MEILIKEYRKYRWFYTKSGKLVIGGKSASQNDEILNHIVEKNKSRIIMHTTEPGSPFCVILADLKDITDSDKEECAIFTGCFSQAWKSGRKTTSVDIFISSQIYKEKSMKAGTWGVKPKVQRVKVPLILTLTRQEEVLRAVPPSTVSKKGFIISLCPGKIDKKDLLPKLELELEHSLDQNEVLSALPAGGIKICR